MKHLDAILCSLILVAALAGCVPADQHENLRVERDELRQTLKTRQRMLEDARKDALKAVTLLENDKLELQRRWNDAQKDLLAKQSELVSLRTKYKIASEEVSQAAENSLALIKEKNALNANIIELRGSIATLRDTVKDLRQRLAEASKPEPDSQNHPEQSAQ